MYYAGIALCGAAGPLILTNPITSVCLWIAGLLIILNN